MNEMSSSTDNSLEFNEENFQLTLSEELEGLIPLYNPKKYVGFNQNDKPYKIKIMEGELYLINPGTPPGAIIFK